MLDRVEAENRDVGKGAGARLDPPVLVLLIRSQRMAGILNNFDAVFFSKRLQIL